MVKPVALAFLFIGLPDIAIAGSAPPLQSRVEAALGMASPGTRFGIVVARDDGTEIVAIHPDGRFTPASNTKIFTTAAAFMLSAIDRPDPSGGTRIRLERASARITDVVIEGRGDARMSSASDCVVDCLGALADAVAAKVRRVRDVAGDDSLYPDQRWSPGMSWNNIGTRSGTATSALSLDNNEIALTATPGVVGAPPVTSVHAYYTIDNQAITVATGATALGFDRAPNAFVVRLTGTIAANAVPEKLILGIDDPAHYTAWRLREMLRARGVRITGTIGVRHRPLTSSDDPANRRGAPAARPPEAPALAQLTPPPLADDLTIINKISQNLYAELMLRRLGLQTGSGSIADGQAAVSAMLDSAGVSPRHYAFSDGSGMSTYNRIAPRGVVTLLRWITLQPWGAAWRATLPVGGEGMLARRFASTALAGRIFAKTGTLNATSALSGYLIAKSGKTLTFSTVANDIPDGDNASKAIDAALIAIAEAN